MTERKDARRQLTFGNAKIEAGTDDHVYVNMYAPGNTPITSVYKYALEAKAAETRSEPIVDNPSEYYLSLIRFSIPLTLVPISIIGIQAQPAPSNVNLTTYSVNIRGPDGIDHQTFLLWTPEDTTIAVPVPPGGAIPPGFSEQFFQYYSLFSYQHFVDMINTALQTSFTAASAGAGWPAAATLAPWFSFDPVTQQCSLSAQNAYASTIVPPNHIDVFFNDELMEFFQSTFQTIYNGHATAGGSDYTMIIKDNGFNRLVNVPNNPPPAAASAGLEMKQEFAAVILWTDFVGIQIQTGGVPVSPEFAGSPGTGSANDAKRPILTDFIPISNGSGVDLRTFLVYVPQSEYRLSDLVGTSPINRIDIQVFWLDDLGGLHPIYVTHNTAVNVKFMFRKKGYQFPPALPDACEKCASGGCLSCGGRKKLAGGRR
jgi:hypothetical protein